MSAPDDLTSLAAVKAWLGLSGAADDALLSGLITAVSRAVLADLGRGTLLPMNVTETYDGTESDTLCLRRWPATQIISVSLDGLALTASASPVQAGYVLEGAAAAPPGAMQRLLYRHGCFHRGKQNLTVTYRAGYEIVGEPALVPTVAPFLVTAQTPFGPWALDTGVLGASGTYTVVNGLYTFTPATAGQSITLSYGFIPLDLAQATCEWVADRYAARSRIGQSAKTLGGQETVSFIVKAMPDIVNRLLQPYRRIAR
jgi:hypothetical protein